MAVYKLFAEKDTTLYSEYINLNSGMDEILELTKDQSVLHTGESTVTRSLIKFNQTDILNVINNNVGTGSFSAYLKLYYADISALPVDFKIITYPIYQSWTMGTGRSGNIPVITDGAGWTSCDYYNGTPWLTGSFPTGVTASFVLGNEGGGSWYTGSFAIQSFDEYASKDIVLDVTNIVIQYVSNSIVNNGFIIMNSGSIEFDPEYTYKLTYFSRDTNTIYPPVLEIRWDDSRYVTGSLVTSNNIYLSIQNNQVVFKEGAKHRFRIDAREQFPTRTFTTSSMFTSVKVLPSSSYYSIRDAKTNDVIIDFDDNYTKISSDTNGNYFDVYMNGLEPERYYRILVKTIVDESTLILDDQYFFKVEQ